MDYHNLYYPSIIFKCMVVKSKGLYDFILLLLNGETFMISAQQPLITLLIEKKLSASCYQLGL